MLKLTILMYQNWSFAIFILPFPLFMIKEMQSCSLIQKLWYPTLFGKDVLMNLYWKAFWMGRSGWGRCLKSKQYVPNTKHMPIKRIHSQSIKFSQRGGSAGKPQVPVSLWGQRLYLASEAGRHKIQQKWAMKVPRRLLWAKVWAMKVPRRLNWAKVF